MRTIFTDHEKIPSFGMPERGRLRKRLLEHGAWKSDEARLRKSGEPKPDFRRAERRRPH
jgi:hypothetical protein